MTVERNRSKRRCCNYVTYAIAGLWNMVIKGHEHQVKDQVKRVVSYKPLQNGMVRSKEVVNMENLRSSPFNMVGTNLTQGYGGFLKPETWKKSASKIMDPSKALRKQGLAVVETSCDESDSKLEQRFDDDKMELMCHESVIDYIDFELARLGQIRSPFQVELQEDFEKKNGR